MSDDRAREQRVIQWCRDRAATVGTEARFAVNVEDYGETAAAMLWAVIGLASLDDESSAVFEAINRERTKRQLEQAKRGRRKQEQARC